jgi:hypothetical protein
MTKKQKRKCITNFMRDRGPTPCCNSYITFMKATHIRTQKEAAESGGTIKNTHQNYPSELWRTMTDSEKAPWIAIAAKDKDRYEQEMAHFRVSELNQFLNSLPKDGELADEIMDEDTYDVVAEEQERKEQENRNAVAALVEAELPTRETESVVGESGGGEEVGGKRKREENGQPSLSIGSSTLSNDGIHMVKKVRVENGSSTTTSSSSSSSNGHGGGMVVGTAQPQQPPQPPLQQPPQPPQQSPQEEDPTVKARGIQYDSITSKYRVTYKHYGLKYFIGYTKTLEQGRDMFNAVKYQFLQQDEAHRKLILSRPLEELEVADSPRAQQHEGGGQLHQGGEQLHQQYQNQVGLQQIANISDATQQNAAEEAKKFRAKRQRQLQKINKPRVISVRKIDLNHCYSIPRFFSPCTLFISFYRSNKFICQPV